MSRYFMIQSWVGSHENEPDYSGQQCGERNVRSSEVVPLYDQYGNANIKAFSDEALESRKNTKPKKSVADSIDLAERHFNRMEQMSKTLDEEYFSGEIEEERYNILRYKMDERLLKSWRRLEKENQLIWELEDIQFNQSKQPLKSEKALSYAMTRGNRENDFNSSKSMGKDAFDNVFKLNYTLVKPESIFSSISDENFTKKIYVACLTAKEKLAKLFKTQTEQ